MELRTSRQRKAVRCPKADDAELGKENDFIVHLQAEADPLELWKSSHGGSLEVVSLERVLFEPGRIDDWEADSGEEQELGFSDSAFADDRSFGYVLSSWCESWGPEGGPWDDVEIDAADGALENAEMDFRRESSFAAGMAEGWVIDPHSLRLYATVRHFLRTFEWCDFKDVEDALAELFVRDLSESPRGLRQFHAMIEPGKLSATSLLD